MVPKVEGALRDALFHKAEYQQATMEMEQVTERIRMSGGARLNPGSMLSLRARRDASVRSLKNAMDAIEATGALVKDLDIGLVDFMAMYQDLEVCLCWKLGEGEIRFWHGVEEGFRGRKPIDQDFVDRLAGGKAGTC